MSSDLLKNETARYGIADLSLNEYIGDLETPPSDQLPELPILNGQPVQVEGNSIVQKPPSEAESLIGNMLYEDIGKLDVLNYKKLYPKIKMRKPFRAAISYLYYGAISKGHKKLPYSELEIMSEEIKQVDALLKPLGFVSNPKKIANKLTKSQFALFEAICPKWQEYDDIDDITEHIELAVEHLVARARKRALPYAKKKFAYYVFYCDPKESPTDSTHLIFLCETAQKVVEGKLSPRLLVAIPPGTAKTQTITVKLSTWYAGRFPKHRILILTYGDTFVKKEVFPFVYDIMTSEWYAEVFPKVSVNPKLQTSAKLGIRLQRGSEYITKGSIAMRSVGQGIIGVRGNFVITDDLFSGYAAATSPVIRSVVNNWLSNDVIPRLLPGCIQVMVNARWSAHDPAATIIDMSNPKSQNYSVDGSFEIIELPLKALGDDDPLGRQRGELIWPKYYPDEHWNSQFARMDVNTILCQYYCKPTDAEVTGFDPKYLNYYNTYPDHKGQDYTYTLISADTASKAKEASDDTVITVWRLTPTDEMYLIDCRAGKWNSVDILGHIADLRSQYRADKVIIEDAGIAPALKDMANQNYRLYGNIDLIHHNNKSKEFRFSGVQHLFRDRKVWFPAHGGMWLTEMMNQLLQFPMHDHDDYVDSVSLALKYLMDHHMDAFHNMGQLEG